MSLSSVVEIYDCLVEELSGANFDPSAAATRENIDRCHQFRTICRILLQIHEQDSTILSDKQYAAISLSFKQAELALDQWNRTVDDSDCALVHDQLPVLQVRYDHSSQSIHLAQEEEDNILDCWTDRAALEEEEAMLVAMASTPIPSETDSTQTILRNKRDSDCLNDEENR